MEAATFIILVILIVGVIMAGYYLAICYPVVCNEQKFKPQRHDPEKNYLLPLNSDHNENMKENVNSTPNGIPPSKYEAPTKKKENNDESRPTAPDTTNRSPNEEDSFASCDVPCSSDDVGFRRGLDVPDCSINVGVLNVAGGSPREEKLQAYRAEPNGVSAERRPLLQGDDEDGLILCQPSVRSKNTGEPIPYPTRVSPLNEADPKNFDDSSAVLPIQPEPTAEVKFYPIQDDVRSLPTEVTPVCLGPSEMIVNIAQPLAVPPERNISASHPATHVVVTMPQPPPLMVAPVYDEPPMDEQPCVSLQQQLHTIVPIPNITSSSEIPAAVVQLETHEEEKETPSDNYGWNDSVVTIKSNEENSNDDHEAEVKPTRLEEDAEMISPSTPEEDAAEHLQGMDPSAPPSAEMEEIPNVVVLKMHTEKNDDEGNSANAATEPTEDAPRAKHHSGESSYSSEPEITEYTFETGHRLPSTNAVLANEISSMTEVNQSSNVQIVRYSAIDDSVALNADASISDSMVVLVGDPIDTNISVTEEGKEGQPGEQCSSPDLTIPRRSPDGDSMKSIEGEPNTSHNISSSQAPTEPKADKPNVQTTTHEKIETEIH